MGFYYATLLSQLNINTCIYFTDSNLIQEITKWQKNPINSFKRGQFCEPFEEKIKLNVTESEKKKKKKRKLRLWDTADATV